MQGGVSLNVHIYSTHMKVRCLYLSLSASSVSVLSLICTLFEIYLMYTPWVKVSMTIMGYSKCHIVVKMLMERGLQ